jgi:ribosomal protein L11 methyltransferase
MARSALKRRRTNQTKAAQVLWRISVTTTPEAEDSIAELLGTITSRPTASHYNVEAQVSLVSVYGPQKMVLRRGIRKKISAGLKHIKSCGLNTGSGRIKITRLRREDWAESWKRHFKPIEISRALLVKPSWSKRPPRRHQAVVILDPGLSFGTGQHPTTSFCLHEIVRIKSRKHPLVPSLLDIGTGSGILAIAAARLGFQPVDAFDFDPEAVRMARSNALTNLVEKHIKITRGDVANLPLRPPRKYDLVCANLISNLLIAERKRISAQLNHGGTLVLAGILKSEFAQVRRAFEHSNLKLLRSRSEKEWCSGSFSHRK